MLVTLELGQDFKVSFVLIATSYKFCIYFYLDHVE